MILIFQKKKGKNVGSKLAIKVRDSEEACNSCGFHKWKPTSDRDKNKKFWKCRKCTYKRRVPILQSVSYYYDHDYILISPTKMSYWTYKVMFGIPIPKRVKNTKSSQKRINMTDMQFMTNIIESKKMEADFLEIYTTFIGKKEKELIKDVNAKNRSIKAYKPKPEKETLEQEVKREIREREKKNRFQKFADATPYLDQHRITPIKVYTELTKYEEKLFNDIRPHKITSTVTYRITDLITHHCQIIGWRDSERNIIVSVNIGIKAKNILKQLEADTNTKEIQIEENRTEACSIALGWFYKKYLKDIKIRQSDTPYYNISVEAFSVLEYTIDGKSLNWS